MSYNSADSSLSKDDAFYLPVIIIILFTHLLTLETWQIMGIRDTILKPAYINSISC